MNLINKIDSFEELPWEKVYEIHSETLSDDIFHTFGKNTEKRFLKFLINTNKGLILIAKEGAIITGFIIIRLQPISMIRFIRKDSLFSFIDHVILDPKIFLKLVIRLIFSLKTKTPFGYAELDYFAVIKEYRGKSIGRELLKEAEYIIKKSGLKGISSITNNRNLLNFYMKNKNARVCFNFKLFTKMFYHVVYDFKQ